MKSVPVLMYHHVAPGREITPAGFAAQMRWLADKGYQTLSLTQFLGFLQGRQAAPDRAVLITFDDGYADNYLCAYPALREHNFRATVFLTTARLTDGPVRPTMAEGAPAPDTFADERGPHGFLTWTEAAKMAADGVFDLGSHTHTHKNFDKAAFYADMALELSVSRDLIREKTGVNPLAVAWPWGVYELPWLAQASSAGYRLAFTTQSGPNSPGSDPLKVRRFKVMKDGTGWFASRIKLYESPVASKIYGSARGLDAKFARAIFGQTPFWRKK